jgi:hypothetical protein
VGKIDRKHGTEAAATTPSLGETTEKKGVNTQLTTDEVERIQRYLAQTAIEGHSGIAGAAAFDHGETPASRFALPGNEYFERLDVSFGSRTVGTNMEYEGQLLLRSGDALAFLRAPVPENQSRAEKATYEAQRREAATLLVYVAMFMKVNTDAAREEPPAITLAQLQKYLPFAENESLAKEVVARETHVITLLNAAQAEIPDSKRIKGFVDASVARRELLRDGAVSDATFGVMLDALRGKDGMFLLVTALAATEGRLTPEQEGLLYEKSKSVMLRARFLGTPKPNEALAPYGAQASLVMLADLQLKQAAQRVGLENGSAGKRAMKFMFGGGGAARSMLKLAEEMDAKRPPGTPSWPQADQVKRRLERLDAMTEAVKKGDRAEVNRLLSSFDVREFRLVSQCGACHTRPKLDLTTSFSR